MLNGPCHIHSAYIDGKRVSRHAMKDCTTFLKLQEAALNKQAEARIRREHKQRACESTMEFLKGRTSQTRDTTMMEDMFHLRGTSQQ
jgi:hypothetical protein